MDDSIRVLVIDDSSLIRELLVGILEEDCRFGVVGIAKNGLSGVQMAQKLKPDIIVMDIEMPLLNGYEATMKIMAEDPRPIVIVSSHINQNEVNSSLRALKAGALAVLPRMSGIDSEEFDTEKEQLLNTLEAMTTVNVVKQIIHKQFNLDTSAPVTAIDPHIPPRQSTASSIYRIDTAPKLLAIAASTGGPKALEALLSLLPTDFPLPILLVQHIGDGFSKGFAEWLNISISLQVKLAEQGEIPRKAIVYVAPDNIHLGISDQGAIDLLLEPPVGRFRPSADILFESASKHYSSALLAIILSGMGNDGVKGLGIVKNRGGIVIAQDEKSSAIYGMASEVVRAGYADFISNPKSIAGLLIQLTKSVKE